MPCCHRASLLGAAAGEAAAVLADASAFTLSDAQDHYVPDLRLRPIHIDMDLNLLPEQERLEAVVTTRVKGVGFATDARTLRLDAMDMDIAEVCAGADGSGLSHTYDGEALLVTWATPFAADEEREVVVRYAVASPLTGMMFSREPAFVAVDSESERARYWLPCLDHPSVRTTLSFTIEAPASFTTVANGKLVGEADAAGGRKVSKWALDFPCPAYLITLASGEFVREEGGSFGDGKPIAFFAPSAMHTSDDLARNFGKTQSMIEWMQAKLKIPMPWPKYYQYCVPNIGGAMENISLVSWDDLYCTDIAQHAERGWVVDIINVHEMTHSYFGDAVVVRDWTHAWLKEGWATYMEHVWLRDTEGEDFFQYFIDVEKRSYMSEAQHSYSRPIATRKYDTSWQMFDHHLYPGGAWRLRMLHALLGEDAFWAGVTLYLQRHWKATSETDDFRRALEETSGRSLERFFDQWVYAPGFPQLKVEYSYNAQTRTVQLTARQTQANKAKGIGLFDFDLDVAVETAEGDWVRTVLHLTSADASAGASLALAARPQQIVLDPDAKVLFSAEFNPGEAMLRRSAESAPTVWGRLHGIRTLAKGASARNIDFLQSIYAKEACFGVRRGIADALGSAGTVAAARALAALLPTERDPRAMGGLTAALATIRHAVAEQALVAWLQTDGPLPPRAKGEALIGLGRMRGNKHLELLKSVLAGRSFLEDSGTTWIKLSCASALAECRTPEASAYLWQRLGDGDDSSDDGEAGDRVRAAVASALGKVVEWQDEGTKAAQAERLDSVCRHDPSYRVRTAAANGLVALGGGRGRGAIELLARTAVFQDRPTVARLLKRLSKQKAGGSGGPAVEDLEDKVRKLEARVAELEKAKEADKPKETDKPKEAGKPKEADKAQAAE